MAPKHNPLKLNPLQLKTLTLLQELARLPDASKKNDETGNVELLWLPPAHGDHFHIGAAVVSGADATGLRNQAVWVALSRKGLVSEAFPSALELTPAGLAYETGRADQILHRHSDH